MTIPRSNPNVGRCRFLLVFATRIICFLAFGQLTNAAPPNSTASRIQRIDVPDDQIAGWAREAKNLISISQSEFTRLLKGNEVDSRSKAAQITAAQHTATLAGRALRDGRSKLTVQRTGDGPVLVPLSHFNLAVRELGWSDRPAVWGADDSGDIWLLADVSDGEIQMTWSAAGRTVVDDIDFELLFPPAETTVFDLRVPRDRIVRSTPEARRIDDGSDANWQAWRLQLGSERRCRIAVSPTKPPEDRRPVILFENELAAIVREEDVRFQTVFQVEVFEAPVAELVFTVPSSVDVFAVTYGQDTPLPWTRSNKGESAGTITVRLPGALLGRSRSIRIDGVAIQKPNTSMVSPQIAVKDGLFISGRQTLTVVAPLQLRSFRPTGFRQQTPLSVSPDGESYTFLQLLPDAQLVLDVGRPPTTLTAQVYCMFETDDPAWTLTSELTWTATSGNVFQTECQFPPEWEITNVRLVSEKGLAERLAGVDVSVQAGGTSLLTVEFPEALTPTISRTIRVLARRRPSVPGVSFTLPAPQPMNCHSVETTLGLVLPSTLSPFVSEDSRAERISPPDINIPSTIRPQQPAINHIEYWYRRESTDAGGTVQLISRLQRIAATSETSIVASPTEFVERYRIRCQADGAPMDRLLVYLTQGGAEIRWSMAAPRQADLTAQRLSGAQNAEWGLPSNGELWELRLPPLPAGTIEVEGRRGNRWSTVSRPALLLLPQAIDRRSLLTLSRPTSLELFVEHSGLVESSNVDVPPRPPEVQNPETDASDHVQPPRSDILSSWKFDKGDATLSLTLRNTEQSREFPTMVSMRLRSLLSANPQGFDLYRAQIRIENGATRNELRIRLDPSAVLQQVTIGGQATVPTMQGDELLISDLNATEREIVELLYRVPSRGGTVRDDHHIIVPQVSASVLAFHWEFALPPSIRLYSEPRGVRLTRPLPTPAWTERIFGPLGRPRDEDFFNPFNKESWQALMQPRNIPSTPIGKFDQELIAPVEWQIHSAVSANAPQEIWIETWQSRETRLLAWISLTINLIIGIVLRIVGWKYRDRVAAYWLALLLAGALCAPSPYAEIAGGAIAGTVIALLSPRKSLITPRRDPSQSVPLGSTHSFDWGAAAGILFVTTWLAVTGLAQETISPSTASSISTGGPSLTNRPTRQQVLVPVDSSGQPSRKLPLVYLSQQLLTSLRESARTREPPKSLIASAQYHVIANSNGGDSLKATFRIHVLDASSDQQVVLPIPDSFLTGENACRLNGRIHPVLTTPNGRGFIVTWTPSLMAPADDGTPTLSQTASFDVELDLKRVGVRTARGGRFSANVPSVAASTWWLTLPEPAVFFDVSGERGAVTEDADHRTFQIDFGSASHFEARWSQNPPEARPRQMKVSQLQFLDLRSTNSELRFRIRCEPKTEPRESKDDQLDAVDFIDLDLPAKCLIREGDIRSTNLLRTEFVTDPHGRQQLRIIFSEPQKQKFSIDGTLLIPSDESVSYQQLPRFGLSRNPNLLPSTIQNWWCVNTSPEFRLDHQNLDPDLLGTITPAEFLQAWGESPPTGRHQLIFQQRENSSPIFTITPQIARRRAVSWIQTGVVGKRRLEWTLKATIESTQAPVYQHVLLVDRRLQIDSISVMVNGAERVVGAPQTRHGTSPTRIVVFLSDKTSGLQQLTVKGSLPTRFGRVTPLPFVKCEEIEQLDSRWELKRESDVDVELELPRGVPPYEAPDDASTEEGPQLIASYQTADPDPKTSIVVSARQARCDARMAAILTRSADSKWKLSGQLKLMPQVESARRMGVLFPARAFDPERVRVERAEATWHEPADGQRRLDLTLRPESDEVTISFDANVQEPTRGDWELPLPEPQEAFSHHIHLLVSPADTWTPFVGTELKPDETPGWAEDFLADLQPEAAATEYRLDAMPIRLRRNQTPTHLDHPEIRFLDHTIWLGQEGQRHGISRAFLSQTRDTIQFQIPDGLGLISLFLDDRPLAMPDPSGGQIRIPLIGVARESILTITWKQSHPNSSHHPLLPLLPPHPPSWLPFSRRPMSIQAEKLPWPSSIDVARSLVTVVPERDEWAVIRGTQRTTTWIEATLDRLAMLLSRQESLGNDPRAALANRVLIDELQSQIESRLSKGIAQSSPQIATHLNRWNQVVEALNRLEPLPNPNPAIVRELRTSQVEEPLIDLPSAFRIELSSDDHSIQFWLFDRDWLGIIAALAISLIAIPLFRRLIRLDWGQWLNARTTVAWLLLGLVWWLWLTPGVLGPLIIAVTTWRSLLQRRRNYDSVVVVEN